MSLFEADSPIENLKQDSLRRKPLAAALARAILRQDDERSLAIGLYGKWGDGKTSLVNLVCSLIETSDDDDKPIVVNFRGWGAQSINELLRAYGRAIREATKNRSEVLEMAEELTAALGEYEDAVTALVPGSAPFMAAAAATGKRLAAADPQERVRRILKKLDQRILVVIDDIDRLSDEEIRFVFRFVNQLADFPNTTYLLPFDYEVVTRALAGVQGLSGEAYLEKVIQVPIYLPPPSEEDIEASLLQMISGLIDTERPDFSRQRFFLVYSQSVRPYVRNQRDVTRLGNEFNFQVDLHGTYVNSIDLLALSALAAFDPRLCGWVANHRDVLVGSSIDLHPQKEREQAAGASLEAGSFRTPKPLEVLRPLFPGALGGSPTGLEEAVREKRICEKSNFDKYFIGEAEPAAYVTWELPEVLMRGDVAGAVRLIVQALADGQNETVLTVLQAWSPYLAKPTATKLAEVLLGAAGVFDAHMPDRFFAPSEAWRAKALLSSLLKVAGPEVARRLLIDAAGGASLTQLELVACLVNDQMLAHGQREKEAAESAQWLTPTGLECAKAALVRRMNALNPLAWEGRTPMMIALWGELDAAGFRRSWRDAVRKDRLALCRLICACAGEWKGTGGGGWGVSQSYVDPAFTRSEAMAVLAEIKRERALASLNPEDQVKVISYWAESSRNDVDHLSTEQAEALVGEWV